MRIILKVGQDSVGETVIGFEDGNDFVVNPFVSPDQNYTVDPLTRYGISRDEAHQLLTLNIVLQDAVQAAIEAACQTVQDALPLLTKPEAAQLHFSDAENREPITQAVARYLIDEMTLNKIAGTTKARS